MSLSQIFLSLKYLKNTGQVECSSVWYYLMFLLMIRLRLCILARIVQSLHNHLRVYRTLTCLSTGYVDCDHLVEMVSAGFFLSN